VMGADYPAETFHIRKNNKTRQHGEYRTPRLTGCQCWKYGTGWIMPLQTRSTHVDPTAPQEFQGLAGYR
jgi:hypothetical protein